jgi:diacylglycerol kinase (ATP)
MVKETTHHGHARDLARFADSRAFDAVVAAGGDGTINEIVNGLAQSLLPLAILPLGTANVLAHELALPRDPADLAEIAAFGPTRTIWPGEIVLSRTGSTHRFLLMAGVGFDATVVEHLDIAMKRRVGKIAYATSIIGRLLSYDREHYRATIDGAAIEPASLIASRARYYGGRFVLTPAARLDEPRLHVVLFENYGRRAAVGYLLSLLRGKLSLRADVRIVTTDRLDLEGPIGAPVQVDGDICVRLPIRVQVAQTPLRLIAHEPPLTSWVH